MSTKSDANLVRVKHLVQNGWGRQLLKSKSWSVEFDAVSDERVVYSNALPSKTVNTQSIIDNMSHEPAILQITGVCTTAAMAKLSTLKKIIRGKELLSYSGRNRYSGLIAQSLETSHPPNISDGFEFTLRLYYNKFTTETATSLAESPTVNADGENADSASTENAVTTVASSSAPAEAGTVMPEATKITTTTAKKLEADEYIKGQVSATSGKIKTAWNSLGSAILSGDTVTQKAAIRTLTSYGVSVPTLIQDLYA